MLTRSRADFAAPAVETTLGTPLVFSAMQSAAIGGWGAPIVGSVDPAGSFMTNGALCAPQRKNSRAYGTKVVESQRDAEVLYCK